VRLMAIREDLQSGVAAVGPGINMLAEFLLCYMQIFAHDK